MMNADSLCDDILIEIFNYLPLEQKVNCELVCKRWKAILMRFCQPRALRFELLIYKRSNYRVICKRPDHQFADYNTIKFENQNDIDKIERILYKYRERVTALCFGFSFFNQFQHLIERTNCLPIMVNSMPNLDHFQCKSFGNGITVDLFEKCRPLLMKIRHFSFDYKEEDITKISMQPWIELLLKYGRRLESVYIKFQRMGIKFPFNLPLPPNLRFLYLPSCDLTREEFYMLCENGGSKLEELSVHSINSNFLPKLQDEMPLLRKLNTRIRVDLNDNGIGLLRLKQFRKMDMIALNQFISPAVANDPVFSSSYGHWTVVEVLVNCPATKHLQLKSLPLVRRYNSGYASEDDDELSDEEEDFNDNFYAENAQQDLNNNHQFNNQFNNNQFNNNQFNNNQFNNNQFNNNQFANNQFNAPDRGFEFVFDILMNEQMGEHEDRRHYLYQTNSFEMNYINRQLKMLESYQANWACVEQVTIKLNERKADGYLNEALNRLILCLSEFRNLRLLQIEHIAEKALIHPMNMLQLVENCKQLTQLHTGSGRRIMPEIVDIFVERAMRNPHKKYELKFKNIMSYNVVTPPNLVLY